MKKCVSIMFSDVFEGGVKNRYSFGTRRFGERRFGERRYGARSCVFNVCAFFCALCMLCVFTVSCGGGGGGASGGGWSLGGGGSAASSRIDGMTINGGSSGSSGAGGGKQTLSFADNAALKKIGWQSMELTFYVNGTPQVFNLTPANPTFDIAVKRGDVIRAEATIMDEHGKPKKARASTITVGAGENPFTLYIEYIVTFKINADFARFKVNGNDSCDSTYTAQGFTAPEYEIPNEEYKNSRIIGWQAFPDGGNRFDATVAEDNITVFAVWQKVRTLIPKEIVSGTTLGVGDIIFSDGKYLKYDDEYTAEEWATVDYSNAIAVIFKGGSIGNALGVGLTVGQNKQWCTASYANNNQSSTVCEAQKNGNRYEGTMDNSVTFDPSDHTDGSSFWAFIEMNSTYPGIENFPAFDFAENYPSGAGAYGSGWYLPSLAELGDLYLAKGAVNNTVDKMRRAPLLGNGNYWSGSQCGYAGTVTNAMYISFNTTGTIGYTEKTTSGLTACAIHRF